MQPGWKGRIVLWLLLLESARANRARYPTLPTAWLPHSLGNSSALWLPELLATLDRKLDLEALCEREPTVVALYQTLRALCVENPHWGRYIAPAVLGYVLSHPHFNIYQGRMGHWRILGFGLDAIPHTTTAFALTLLMRDGLDILAHALPPQSFLAPLAQRLARQPALASAGGLALLSALWEGGEYLMQQVELRRTGGDWEAINMQWTPDDMGHDLLSNAAGWAVATWLRQR